MGLLRRSLETKQRLTAHSTRIEDTIFALRREGDQETLAQIEIHIPLETVKKLKKKGLL